jgi:hypothetical protein
MPLSWNEIKSRATFFSKEWLHESSEDAEAKSFWDDFFNVFGISRRRVATFEEQVHKIGERTGYIDLLWKGVIIIEHKSRGKNLDKAYHQAKEYFPGLKEKELPRYILVSDFARFRLYDLDKDNSYHEFGITDLVKHVHLFGFIAGYEKRTFKEQDPVNIEAAELMGRLHDKLRDIGYSGHDLEVYLVRLVFCLFADNTNIFEKGIFYDYIDLRTNEDGSDLSGHIAQIFEILDTPAEERLKNLDENLASFPYVNGKLFEERLSIASFDKTMRKILLDCCLLDWGKISPAIFGSLFQSVMDAKARRNLGAHYTSEKNILKLIKPLFLDDLWGEFEKVKKESRASIDRFHTKISELRFLDPACGCGNFLIITYRELRILEIEVIRLLLKDSLSRQQAITDIGIYVLVDVDKFYGIEYEEFPAQIAQVAMWLIDHQMNQLVSETFGDYYVRLPLRKSATIKKANALQQGWQDMIEQTSDDNIPFKFNYILGNPPFIGSKFMTEDQRADIEALFKDTKGNGVLDYVTGWYLKAMAYTDIYNQKNKAFETKSGFVSTNSISQGEQPGILWSELMNKYHATIEFAHRTFKWGNEARSNAAVHVVIIGFSQGNKATKRLYDYEDISGEPHEIIAKNINPYLLDAPNIFILSRQKPLQNTTVEIGIGNKPIDGGNYLFTKGEKDAFISKQPESEKYFRRWLGSEEFINGIERWVLWLGDAEPNELNKMPRVIERIEAVKQFRLASKSLPTQKLAQTPTRFHVENFPKSQYLLIPEVSSERRKYIPIGFIDPSVVSSNLVKIVPNATLFHFGILTSLMHMCWVKYVCGRLKSDYRYSKDIVFNNFPWPQTPKTTQIEKVELLAQRVLDIRITHNKSTLAHLYDPNTMPSELLKAHQALDKTIDLFYRPQPFQNEAKRIEFLFELYDKYTSGLFFSATKKKKR